MCNRGSTWVHIKFQGHWSVGSGEEDSLKVFTIYGHGGYIGHVTLTVCIYFHSLSPKRLYKKSLTFGPVAFEEMLETVIL